MKIKSILASIAVLSLATAANAAVITFNGDGDGSGWNDPNNWDLDRVPADGDAVVIPDTYTVHVDVATARSDSVEVQTGAVLIIDQSMKLEIDMASSVADMQGIQLAGSTSVLKTSGSFTFSGAGSIEGQNDAAKILIKSNTTLTLGSTTTAEGQFTIEGEYSFSLPNGAFKNDGTVDANVVNGTVLVHANTIPAASTIGAWNVSDADAVLRFDAGTSCGTEIGDLDVQGTLHIDSGVTLTADIFNLGCAGAGAGTSTSILNYDSFSSDCVPPRSNPQLGTACSGTHEYTDMTQF